MRGTPFDIVIDRLKQHGCDPAQNGAGWKARCPSHEDNNPSLSISEGDDGKVLICCHTGCTNQAIVGDLGLTMADLFPPTPGSSAKPSNNGPAKKKRDVVFPDFETAVNWMARKIPAAAGNYWNYHDAGGSLLFRVQRFDLGDGSKEFKPFRRDPDGWRMKDPVGKLPLYHLDDLVAATTVWVCDEGEKCCDLARASRA